MGLPQNFRWDERFIIGNDSAGVDNFKQVAAPFRFPVNSIPRDARLVGNNRSARARQAIEKRGFPHIGPAHNHQRWKFFGHECVSRDICANPGNNSTFHCNALEENTERSRAERNYVFALVIGFVAALDFFVARLLVYNASSARASISSGRSPIS